MSDTFIVPTLSDLGSPCYRTEQDRYNDYFNKTIWSIPHGITGVVVSDSEPSVENRDKVWFRLGTDLGLATPVPLVYSTDYARWVGRHPKQAGGGYNVELWTGSVAQLWAYDGGDGTDPASATATTGAMWEVYAAFADKVPVGVGATVAAPLTTLTRWDATGAPIVPDLIGAYFIRRSARIYYTV